MPVRYKLSPYAEEEFAAVLYEIAELSGWSHSMDFEERLYKALQSLARNPGIGHLRQDLLPRKIYFHYVRPYMVPYLRATESLYVVGVIHGARDYSYTDAGSAGRLVDRRFEGGESALQPELLVCLLVLVEKG